MLVTPRIIWSFNEGARLTRRRLTSSSQFLIFWLNIGCFSCARCEIITISHGAKRRRCSEAGMFKKQRKLFCGRSIRLATWNLSDWSKMMWTLIMSLTLILLNKMDVGWSTLFFVHGVEVLWFPIDRSSIWWPSSNKRPMKRLRKSMLRPRRSSTSRRAVWCNSSGLKSWNTMRRKKNRLNSRKRCRWPICLHMQQCIWKSISFIKNRFMPCDMILKTFAAKRLCHLHSSFWMHCCTNA